MHHDPGSLPTPPARRSFVVIDVVTTVELIVRGVNSPLSPTAFLMTIPLLTPIRKVLSSVDGRDFAVPDSARAETFIVIAARLAVRYL